MQCGSPYKLQRYPIRDIAISGPQTELAHYLPSARFELHHPTRVMLNGTIEHLISCEFGQLFETLEDPYICDQLVKAIRPKHKFKFLR